MDEQELHAVLTLKEAVFLSGGILLMLMKNQKQIQLREDLESERLAMNCLSKLCDAADKLPECKCTQALSFTKEHVNKLLGGERNEYMDGVKEASPSQVM